MADDYGFNGSRKTVSASHNHTLGPLLDSLCFVQIATEVVRFSSAEDMFVAG